jgi:very-short-patch-repair endonuclease
VGVSSRAMVKEFARHLRRNRTAAERHLWRELRELKQAGFKFRQQVPIDQFIVDFACLSERLIIEVDGGTHSTDQEVARDVKHARYMKDQGFRILRVWNSDARQNLEGVMDAIVAALHTPTPDPSPRRVVSKTRFQHDDAPPARWGGEDSRRARQVPQ